MRALFFVLILLAQQVCADIKSPADNFGDLFVQVQLQKIFPDGKTFVDAQPKIAPDAIMRDYQQVKPATKDELRQFVLHHFEIPAEQPAVPAATAHQYPPLLNHIKTLWSQLERPVATEIANSSALSLPNIYVVPGGRFREVYYWDTYFTLLGLAADGRNDLIEAMLNNFVSLIAVSYTHLTLPTILLV